jgi:hypothetical protein
MDAVFLLLGGSMKKVAKELLITVSLGLVLFLVIFLLNYFKYKPVKFIYQLF